MVANSNDAYFTGDGEMLVDRLVAASVVHKQEKPQLPGFGRDLVPYFVPGADEWDENNLNYSGADGAAQPPNTVSERPSSAGSGRKKKNQGGSNSPERIDLRPMANQQQSAKKNKGNKLSSSPPMPSFVNDAGRDRAVQDAFAAAAAASRKPAQKSAPDSAQKNKAAPAGPRFAGPAFSNSPTPESLPMPSFLLSGFSASEPSPATEIKRLLQMEPRTGSPCMPTETATDNLKALLQLNNSIAC